MKTVELDCVRCHQYMVFTYYWSDQDPRFTCGTCDTTYQIISDFEAETPLFQVTDRS